MPRRTIDSHIHLWPESAANPDSHAWMEMVPALAKRHELQDYHKAIREHQPSAIVPTTRAIYIETDRRYLFQEPLPVKEWATGPLDEIKYLRSVVEEESQDADMLAAIVLWAPLDRGEAVFHEWLELAERSAGPPTWQKVKGFRFLLQAIRSSAEFEKLVLSEPFIRILAKLGSIDRGFAFDVGIDQHHGGVWQLEVWQEVLQRVADTDARSPTTFILSKQSLVDD
ncbi:hypothetical protein ANO11243_054480 [Dothideomycetidae sp. 11243]|nr:hypothetical protein ANO11243_054480 [fungal sp. No.11243]